MLKSAAIFYVEKSSHLTIHRIRAHNKDTESVYGGKVMNNIINYEFEGISIEVENIDEVNKENIKKRYAAFCVAIRNKSGMNRKEFAKWLGIPYRTIQDWERGVSQVPDYVLHLIAYRVKIEDELKRGELKYVNY